ncbi:MAG: DUF6624 domain-containing protein [Gammaproteobacteria bacterium]
MQPLNRQLAEQLLDLQRRDNETREQLLQEGRLFGVYSDEMQAVHTDNAQALNAIIEQHGWPGLSLVGEEAARAAWLVAQHAICTPGLQRKFRDCLAEAVAHHEAPKWQLASLEDRICFNEGRPQLYGTVFDWNAQGELVCEVEQDEGLDARRTAVGLPPFDAALARERAAARAEGGKPTEDYADYRRRAADWARKVGWRD